MQVVRSLFAISVSVVAALAVFVGGLSASEFLMKEPEPHQFAHLDQPLWTSKPIVIDREKQTYERLPALVASANVPAIDVPEDVALSGQGRSVDTVDSQSAPSISGNDQVVIQTAQAEEQPAAIPVVAADSAHFDWCFSRYKSYRMEDNSYQPFGGGPRRSCQSPAG